MGFHVFDNWMVLIFFFFLLYILSASTHHPQPPQASTPYSLESESLGMECMISGSASPTLAINTVTNKVLQPAIQPPAPTHTWLHGCTLTPPTSPTSYSTIPHRESSTLLKDTHKLSHTQSHVHMPKASLQCNPHQNTQPSSGVAPSTQQKPSTGSCLRQINTILILIAGLLQSDRYTVPANLHQDTLYMLRGVLVFVP